jgi:hypothetical protein
MNKNQQFHFGRAQHHFQSGNTSHALRHLHLSGAHFGADALPEPPHSNDVMPPVVDDDASEEERKCGKDGDCANPNARPGMSGDSGDNGSGTRFGRKKHTPGFGVCAACGR